MYAVPIILAHEGVGLGSESDISDAEQSQMYLRPNMRTNVTKYVEFI
jgi:hypothetical protein